jgi:cytochrome b pre-mRNA-processing protein 3
LRRLRGADAKQQVLAQGVFDEFCRDMDHNLREMGISDPGVPKQMQRVGQAFYGRVQAYEAALGMGADGALAAALARNVYADEADPPVAVAALASYVRDVEKSLNGQSLEALMAGEVRFPEPAPFSRAAAVAE